MKTPASRGGGCGRRRPVSGRRSDQREGKRGDERDHHQRDQQGQQERPAAFDELGKRCLGQVADQQHHRADRRGQRAEREVEDHHDSEMHRVNTIAFDQWHKDRR